MDKWEDRILCRDESCIGTIGNDGRCRICGLDSGDQPNKKIRSGNQVKKGDADAVPPGQGMPPDEHDSPSVDDVEDENNVLDEANINTSDERWEDRILCRDESCTGTIGKDGQCRICGLTLDPGK